MKTVSGKSFIKILEKKGWVLKRVHGSHYIFSHPDKNEIISVPVYKNEDLKKGLQIKLMTIAEISENELQDTLTEAVLIPLNKKHKYINYYRCIY